MFEENKRIVLSYVSALSDLFTPDALIYGVLGWGEIEKVKPIWRQLMHSFQLNLQVESMIAEGDIVAVRYTERGTFAQPFFGRGRDRQALRSRRHEMV